LSTLKFNYQLPHIQYFVERPAEVSSTFPVPFRERFERQFDAHFTIVREFIYVTVKLQGSRLLTDKNNQNTFQGIL
jgi:hypothetical protein